MSQTQEKSASALSWIQAKTTSFFSKRWHYAITLPLLFLAILAFYFIFCYQETPYVSGNGFNGTGKMEAAFVLAVLVAVGVIFVFVYKGIQGTLNAEVLAKGFVVLSAIILVMMGGYHYLNDNAWKHDWSVNNGWGHWSVIYEIFNTGKWPDVAFNNQHYQPKLWQTCLAIFMKIMSAFMPIPADNSVIAAAAKNGYSLYTQFEYNLMESNRILIAYVGVLSLILGYRILRELPLKGSKLAVATFLFSFTPVIWYLPWYTNNDSFAFFFALAGLYFALRYRRHHSWGDIICCALGIGLGMECKLNAGMVAFPVALVFLYELLKEYRKKEGAFVSEKKERTQFWIQILVFAAIVFPLGLAYSVYAKLAFGMPVGYVLDLEHDLQGNYSQNWMHITETSFFLRFLAYPSPDLFFGTIWNMRASGSWGNQDFNIWTAFLKTALWGEGTPAFSTNNFTYALCAIVYYLVILLGVVFVVYAIVRIVLAIKNKTNPSEVFYLTAITFLTSAFGYGYFAYKYPVGCSMNARYSMLLLLPLAIGMSSGIVDGIAALKKSFPAKE